MPKWRAKNSAKRIKLKELQNNCCNICKKELKDNFYVLDHIIPIALNGSNKIDNLQLICLWCNKTKTFKDAKEINQNPKIKKTKNGNSVITCPLCPLNFIATSEKQAESNFNMHYIHRHAEMESEDG